MKAFFVFTLAVATKASVSAVHYEEPPCGSDEKAVQIMGIDGVFCSPECTPECPTDTPDGVTAVPTCALQSPTGDQYCAILCTPSVVKGGDCGPKMECAPIPGSGGFGLCVYPASSTFLRSPESIKAEFIDIFASGAETTTTMA
eukprot:CAMPEP_0168177286 /NCGR_PEP_ID=MMETSP0139_2-20121125/8355_1 /TAXON_ID=44445 /ORGANISM="Pseudo-nitzschia australis, Strain 10249 10 AB" /LENGTH=143 /DNA_ID=CAMNT_0008096291 /DNA_START=119 /DNA_END=550 /DNA_ORIENTATION=-